MHVADWLLVALALVFPFAWGWVVDAFFERRGWNAAPRGAHGDAESAWHYQI
jgi:hypothetical protein